MILTKHVAGLGAIGFDLLTGSPPFGGNNYAKIQQNIIKQKLQLPYFLGPDAKDLLIRLLRKEPHKRLGGTQAKDIKILKAHRFFRKIDWKKLETRELEPVCVKSFAEFGDVNLCALMSMFACADNSSRLLLAHSTRHHGSRARGEFLPQLH